MTEQNHPITPPPELIQQWRNEGYDLPGIIFSEYVATRAYQAGADQGKADIKRERQEAADQELEACCEWIHGETSDECFVANLRAARRPKPPSLKELALKDVDEILKNPGSPMHSDFDRIISALKSIPDPS
jgi:hypothetical protein